MSEQRTRNAQKHEAVTVEVSKSITDIVTNYVMVLAFIKATQKLMGKTRCKIVFDACSLHPMKETGISLIKVDWLKAAYDRIAIDWPQTVKVTYHVLTG